MVKTLDTLGARYKDNKEFIQNIISLIMKTLSPPKFLIKEEAYQILRKEYLEFLNKFPWFEDLQSHILTFFEM